MYMSYAADIGEYVLEMRKMQGFLEGWGGQVFILGVGDTTAF